MMLKAMKRIIKSRWFPVCGIILGAVGGFLYYQYVGCVTGSCSITSKPLNSTIYGAVLGGLGFAVLQSERISKQIDIDKEA